MIHLYKPKPYKTTITHDRTGKWVRNENNKVIYHEFKDGKWVKYEHDSKGNRTYEEYSNGSRYKTTYEKRKKVLTIGVNSDGDKSWTRYKYNKWGKTMWELHNDGRFDWWGFYDNGKYNGYGWFHGCWGWDEYKIENNLRRYERENNNWIIVEYNENEDVIYFETSMHGIILNNRIT